MTTTKQTVTALAIASPAFALDAFEAQRAGSIEAILAGQAAKLGGATTIQGMDAPTIRAGLKKLDAREETIEYMLSKHERDTSCFLKRGRVWLHVLFNEPKKADAVAAMNVTLREDVGRALAGVGSYNVEGFVVPETIDAAKDAVTSRVTDAVAVARENGKPVAPGVADLARQLKVKGHTTVKVKKKGDATPKGAQKRMTLNGMAENYQNVTRGPASWIEEGLTAGRVVAVQFKSETEAQAFIKAMEDAAAKNK